MPPKKPTLTTTGNLGCSLSWLWTGMGAEHQDLCCVCVFTMIAFPSESDSQVCFLIFKLSLQRKYDKWNRSRIKCPGGVPLI